MTDAERLAEDRALRGEAKDVLTERYAGLKTALSDRGIPARLGDLAAGKAKAAGREALAVASENKGIVAGTLGLLALWFVRKPLIAEARRQQPRLQRWLNALTEKFERD